MFESCVVDGGHRVLRFPVLPGINHQQVGVEALLLKALQALGRRGQLRQGY